MKAKEEMGSEGGARWGWRGRRQRWPQATVISRQSWGPWDVGLPGPLQKRQEPVQNPHPYPKDFLGLESYTAG